MKTCYNCTKPAEPNRIRCSECLKVQAAYRATHKTQIAATDKAFRNRHKKAVFDHYGRSCSCCSEAIEAFLCIDHVDGGGSKHRKQVGSGHRFYQWLVKNGFPEGFQTLCHNCNMGRMSSGGVCPHKILKP